MSFGNFGEPPSGIPLEEATKVKKPKQFTPEIMEIAEDIQIKPSYVKGWFVKNDKVYTTKGELRMDFFNYVMNCSTIDDLEGINVGKLNPKQQMILDQKIEEGGLTSSDLSLLNDYIEENVSLRKQLRDVINNKGTKTLKGLQEDHDKLYKKVEKLQSERDAAVRALETITNEYEQFKEKLEWLYDFMGRMDEGYDDEDTKKVTEIKQLVKGEV